MTKKVKLTPLGKARLDILYRWLKMKRIKGYYMKLIKENTDRGFNEAYLIASANDPTVPVCCLFIRGFCWRDTPEGEQYWAGIDDEYTNWAKTLKPCELPN